MLHPHLTPSLHIHIYFLLLQDLSTIGPRRYESKTMPGGKGVGKVKRKLESAQVSSTAPKKARG